MRSFPRTVRRRMAVAAVATAVGAGVMTLPSVVPSRDALDLSASVATRDKLKDRQKKVQKRVGQAKHALEESSAALRRAHSRLEGARTELDHARVELATARGRLAVAEEKDAQMQTALEEARATLAQSREDLRAGRASLRDQQKVVTETVVDLYTDGDPDLEAFTSMLEAGSTEEFSRQSEVRQVAVGKQTSAYDEMHAAEVLLGVRKEQLKAAKEDVKAKRRAAADHLVVVQDLEAEADEARTEVWGLIGKRRDAQDVAREVRQEDLTELRKQKQEQARVAEMLRKRALRALRAARAKQGRVGPTGGVLSKPVPGAVTSPFGYRRHPIYGYWGLHDGTDFGVSCGEPIHAAADGRVVSSYYSSVYGRRLIVDHGALRGAGVATIYNHASSYTVGPGASVSRGQVIGYVGNTGWSTGCHLHFTVMANGQAVDPMNWL